MHSESANALLELQQISYPELLHVLIDPLLPGQEGVSLCECIDYEFLRERLAMARIRSLLMPYWY